MSTRSFSVWIAGVVGAAVMAGGISAAALASTSSPPNPKSTLPANTNPAPHKDPNDPRGPVAPRPNKVLTKQQIIDRARAVEAKDPGHVVVCYGPDGSVVTVAEVDLAPGTTLTTTERQGTCDRPVPHFAVRGLHPSPIHSRRP